MEVSNLSDAELKALFIRMLEELSFKEVSEDLNSIKKIPSDTKDKLIEIKNNLQGNNSRVHEAENKPMIWNISRQKRTNQNKKK